MMAWNEIVQFACCLDDLINSRITKLNDITGFQIYEVIMLNALISLFKLRYVSSKLMFDHKVTVKKEFNRIIEGCPTYPVVFILHKNIEGFDIKVSFPGVDFIEYGIPFRSFAMTFLFQILCEYLLNSFLCLIHHHN